MWAYTVFTVNGKEFLATSTTTKLYFSPAFVNRTCPFKISPLKFEGKLFFLVLFVFNGGNNFLF